MRTVIVSLRAFIVGLVCATAFPDNNTAAIITVLVLAGLTITYEIMLVKETIKELSEVKVENSNNE